MDRFPAPRPNSNRASTVDPASTVGRAPTVRRASLVEPASTSHKASCVPRARTQPPSLTSGINQTQQQFQERVSHSVPSAQHHPSQSNIKKPSYLSIEETQGHAQPQQQRNVFMPPVPPAPQLNLEPVQRAQLAALDRLYFISGQAVPMQLAGSPAVIPQNANGGGRQLNPFDAPSLFVPMMRPLQIVHQMQASTEYGNMRNSQSPDRAEDAIRNARQVSPLQYST